MIDPNGLTNFIRKNIMPDTDKRLTEMVRADFESRGIFDELSLTEDDKDKLIRDFALYVRNKWGA